MKVISILIFNYNNQNPILLSSSIDLSSFSIWQRSTFRELVTFTSREVLKKQSCPIKGIFNFNEEYQMCLNLENNGIACVVISDIEYPVRVIFELIPQMIQEFTQFSPKWSTFPSDQNIYFPYLANLLAKMQDPTNVDKISKIQINLIETQNIIKESLERLQIRTEDLKELSQKSKDLSDISKKFVIQSEKLNSCCQIL